MITDQRRWNRYRRPCPAFFSFGTRGTIGGCQVDIYFDDDSLLCPAGRSVGQAAYGDGRTEDGEQVSSGTYFYQIEADGYTDTRKMVILK